MQISAAGHGRAIGLLASLFWHKGQQQSRACACSEWAVPVAALPGRAGGQLTSQRRDECVRAWVWYGAWVWVCSVCGCAGARTYVSLSASSAGCSPPPETRERLVLVESRRAKECCGESCRCPAAQREKYFTHDAGTRTRWRLSACFPLLLLGRSGLARLLTALDALMGDGLAHDGATGQTSGN